MLPFPAQGHIKPMLCLAELLCHHAGNHVTFVNTHHNHRRLTNLQDDLSSRYPTLHFESISDGLPEDHPRGGLNDIVNLIWSIQDVTKPLFRDMLRRSCESNGQRRPPPVSCVITDGIMSFAVDAAVELQMKVIVFRTFSASSLWAYFCLPKVIETGEIPFTDKDMDKPVTSIPGMENVLRRRDLPSITRVDKVDHPVFKFFINETLAMTRASGLIINTFEKLEAPMISELASFVSKIYTIGPLHALLRSVIKDYSPPSSSSNGLLWREDRDFLHWLDTQPLKSVVFVSFGSLVQFTPNQMLEFLHGLLNSDTGFLWVIRPDSVTGKDESGHVLRELKGKTGVKGRICSWAPQEEVLAHPSIGGFLTHSGWNSTMESIYAGQPMICWPMLADQQVNSRCVSDVWKIGLDMKDTCDRSTVEKMVRDLMVDKREEIMKSTADFARMAHDSVVEGGSSYSNLMELIGDIKSTHTFI